MIRKKKFYCIVILCCATIITNAQNNKTNRNLNQELEFEKLIYNNQFDDEVTNKLIFEKSKYFKQNKLLGKAIETLERINENDLSDSIKFELYYQLAILNYLEGNYADVELNINKINYFISDSIYKDKLVLLQILNFNNAENWQEGKKLLITQLKNKKDSVLINHWYEKALKYKPKNEKTAQAWQTFLPGTGHVYVGKTIHGIINSTLILSGLAWGGYNFYNGFYFAGTFSGFFISYMFYSGGINYAISNVKKYNLLKVQKINRELNAKIISILQP